MYPFLLKTGLLCWGGGGGAEGELTELLPLSVSIPLKDRTSLLGGGGGGELTELLPLSVSIPLKDRTSLLGGGGGGGRRGN